MAPTEIMLGGLQGFESVHHSELNLVTQDLGGLWAGLVRQHLKMMRLLFLCLLLLPAATAVSEETEGSANGDVDDEDGIEEETVIGEIADVDLIADKATGSEGNPDQITMIVIIVAVAALTLSVSAIVTIMLVRRNMQKREQGIYSVPAEQDQKGV